MLYVCAGVIYGCMDEVACNYDQYVTQDDGSCDYPEMFKDCEETCLNDIDLDGVCDDRNRVALNLCIVITTPLQLMRGLYFC